MRSLSLKLVLAFVLTSLISIILAALLIRQLVERAFETYLIDQQRTMFITDVTAYYEQTGTWDGVGRWLMLRGPTHIVGPAPVPEAQIMPVQVPLTPFVLVDLEGRVVVPFDPFVTIRIVSADEIARGTPVIVDGAQVGTVLTPQQPAFRSAAEELYLRRTDLALLIAAGLTLAVALGLGMLLARLITRPVRELTTAAQSIAGGDLSQRVPVRSRDELGVLAAQFNQMGADLERALHLRRQMTADVAHDLRTPLTVVSGYLEALRDGVLRPTPERFATLHDETQLLLHLVDDLHTLSLADAGELTLSRRRLPPRALLERAAETHRHHAEQAGLSLTVDVPADLPELSVDAEQLARVLHNLVSNAIRHTPSGGSIALAAERAGDGVALSVADTGDGIPAEHLPHIFERFYRADAARQQATGGSGLGLAIVRSVVEAHGGKICASSEPGHGTRFTLTLPAG